MMKKIGLTTVLCMLLLLWTIPTALAASEREPNDSSGTATAIEVNTEVTGNLSESSDKDYYRFTLTQPGTIQVRFEQPASGSSYLHLYEVDAGGGLSEFDSVTYSSNSSAPTGSFTQTTNRYRVPAGEYYILLENRSVANFSSADYTLYINYTAEPGDEYEKEYNDTSSTANQIATNTTITGNLSNSSDKDYYTFALTEPGCIQVIFEQPANGAYYVWLYEVNAAGSLDEIFSTSYLASGSSPTGSFSQASNRYRVPAGTYYVLIEHRAYSDFSNDDYTLTVNYTAEPGKGYEKEYNDASSTANQIDINTPIVGNLSDSSDKDYFKFTLSQTAEAQVKFEQPVDGNYTVRLYEVSAGGSLNQIESSTYAAESASTGTVVRTGEAHSLAGGEYYVLVEQRTYYAHSDEDYTLTILSDDPSGVSSSTYTDVNPGDWFYDAVELVTAQGLFSGTSDTEFSPNTNMTRAMFVTVLGRLAEQSGETVTGYSNTFTDVPAGQWYSDYVSWAAAKELVEGYDQSTFGTGDNITREQMAVLMIRFSDYMDIELNTSGTVRFTDMASVSDWARDGVLDAASAGLINGHEDGSFGPKDTATRAQVATVFMNFLNNYF